MQSPTRVSQLAALSLCLSLVENSLPHALPFLRLGLSNLTLLWALTSLSWKDTLALAALKWLLSSLVSGLIASPYAIVSLAGNTASIVLMLLMHGSIRRWLSLYSISALGAAASSFAQMATASLFISPSVMRLLPLMMIFSTLSGVAMAAIALRLAPAERIRITGEWRGSPFAALPLLPFALAIVALAFTEGIGPLLASFLLALASCRLAGRRIRVLPYLATIAAVVVFNLLVPSGRVIWLFVTEGALTEGLEKALRLASMVAISQSLSASVRPAGGLIGQTLSLYSLMTERFLSSTGPLLERVRALLAMDDFSLHCVKADRRPRATATAPCLAIALFALISRLACV